MEGGERRIGGVRVRVGGRREEDRGSEGEGVRKRSGYRGSEEEGVKRRE